ncbi:hypothetical protein [Alphaproteobacteria bacterium endosymbiont of Tiliacea citrago]|uniref:hypothetical protein n=1 Tax=Alphaproteobacteria bacterium endosymbiont of Tiliacea citrago TaxID=3077944 RepID=UPI00313B1F41
MNKSFKIFFISSFFCNISSVTDLQFAYSISVECEKLDKELNEFNKKIQASKTRIKQHSIQNPKKADAAPTKRSCQEKNI